MALFTTATDANYRETRGRSVSYSSVPTLTSEETEAQRVLYYTLTRTSEMDFEYFGMTEASAKAAASELQTEYTRKYAAWDAIDHGDEIYPRCKYKFENTSTIYAEPEEGDNWKVTAKINEEDSIITTEELTTVDDIEQYFQEALAREGALGFNYISITEATWSDKNKKIYITFKQNIENFSTSLYTVEVYDAAEDTWTAVPTLSKTESSCNITADMNKTVRINYNSGTVVSKKWTTNDYSAVTAYITNAILSTEHTTEGEAAYIQFIYYTDAVYVNRGLSATITFPDRSVKYDRVPQYIASHGTYTDPSGNTYTVHEVKIGNILNEGGSIEGDVKITLGCDGVEPTMIINNTFTCIKANYVLIQSAELDGEELIVKFVSDHSYSTSTTDAISVYYSGIVDNGIAWSGIQRSYSYEATVTSLTYSDGVYTATCEANDDYPFTVNGVNKVRMTATDGLESLPKTMELSNNVEITFVEDTVAWTSRAQWNLCAKCTFDEAPTMNRVKIEVATKAIDYLAVEGTLTAQETVVGTTYRLYFASGNLTGGSVSTPPYDPVYYRIKYTKIVDTKRKPVYTEWQLLHAES